MSGIICSYLLLQIGVHQGQQGLPHRDGAEQGGLVPDGRLHATSQLRGLLLHLLRWSAHRHTSRWADKEHHLLKMSLPRLSSCLIFVPLEAASAHDLGSDEGNLSIQVEKSFHPFLQVLFSLKYFASIYRLSSIEFAPGPSSS